MPIPKRFAHARKPVLPLLLLLALPSAGAAAWKPLGPPTLGLEGPSALAFDPARPGRAFAGLAGGGIAKSDDGGATWRMTNRGLTLAFIRALAVEPANGQRVYALAYRTLHRSTDGGESWAPLRSPVDTFQLDPRDPAVLWTGSPDGLFRSGDDGATWRRIRANLPASPRVDEVLVDPREPRRIYLSLGGSRDAGLWVSEDGGRSWDRRRRRQLLKLSADPHAAGTVIAWSGGSFLERSRDAGRTWEPFFDAATARAANAYPVGLVADPQQAGRFFVLVTASDPTPGLYVTTDGGRHWHASAAGMPDFWFPSALAVDRGGALLVGGQFDPTHGDLFRSADAGAHWQPASRGLANATVSALAVSRRGTLFAAGLPFGLARSLDGGASWAALSLATADPPTAEPVLGQLAADPSDPDTLYAVKAYPFDSSATVLWKTTDGGTSWHPLPYPLPAESLPFDLLKLDLAVDPADPRTLFLASESRDWEGISRSRDGGQSWEAVLSGAFVGLAVHPGAPGRVLALSPFGVYRSTDQGDHWDKMLDPGDGETLYWLAGAPSDPNVVYALKENYELFRSLDGGASWRSLGPRFEASVVAVDPLDANTLLFVGQSAVSQGVVRLTLGRGRSPVNDGLFDPLVTALLFDPGDPTRLLAATEGAGVMEYRFPPAAR